jgi:hypothetical protein
MVAKPEVGPSTRDWNIVFLSLEVNLKQIEDWLTTKHVKEVRRNEEMKGRSE